ncbi:hypothetical protein KSF_088400 [Reticulibacter mediterranei]|uniref:Uncharacterized protein n=1 Tax=Reticulibacter mediterranei TaxID=2778369 RepID=A0A8J3N907_9CHLR|nr:hypothetical protein [Reticulibacter mediterranei]GHO98792.1 hypothetical protein KSF_088400 [Reticulibacter mediterranei]
MMETPDEQPEFSNFELEAALLMAKHGNSMQLRGLIEKRTEAEYARLLRECGISDFEWRVALSVCMAGDTTPLKALLKKCQRPAA